MTKSFSGISLDGDSPPNICQGCAQHGVEHLPSGTVFVYCTHNRTGVFRQPGGVWNAREYIDLDEFRRSILAGVLQFESAAGFFYADGMTEQ